MKRSIIAISLLSSLLLTSCQSSYESFYVPYNLDYQYQESTHFSPITLSAKQLRTMIESKQSFALYYYSDNCMHCPNSTELLNKYLQVRSNQIEFYKISATEYLIDRNGDKFLAGFDYLFEATPNIYFFKDGVSKLSLPRNKYSSGFPVFESTLNDILKKSKMYITTLKEGYDYFLANNTNYLIFLRDISSTQSETSNISYSYKIYKDVIYNKMSTCEYSSLILDVTKIEAELYNTLNDQFNISSYDTTNLAIYKYTPNLISNSYETGVIDYSNDEGINTLNEIIDNKFISKI